MKLSRALFSQNGQSNLMCKGVVLKGVSSVTWDIDSFLMCRLVHLGICDHLWGTAGNCQHKADMDRSVCDSRGACAQAKTGRLLAESTLAPSSRHQISALLRVLCVRQCNLLCR